MTKTETTHAKVARIIADHDAIRINEAGGYPTDWLIRHGTVYWADLDAAKDYRRTELIVLPVAEFIAEYDLEDDDAKET